MPQVQGQRGTSGKKKGYVHIGCVRAGIDEMSPCELETQMGDGYHVQHIKGEAVFRLQGVLRE
jgi:hypothetical protein